MARSRELALAIDCCRSAFTRNAASGLVSSDNVDWARFLRVVRFHRVQGLVGAALGPTQDRLPPDISAALANDAARIAAGNLRTAVHCRELLEDFEKAGIRLLFVKGLTLGALAYGNAAIKAAVDIDLLVPENEVVDAARILERRGYSLHTPRGPATADRIRTWHRASKESMWIRREPRSQIDLHTRLSDNESFIPSIGLGSPQQTVEVGKGISLPTLATDELIAYLCFHGAWSAWFRLKWVADFAALLHGTPADELRRLYRRSIELGAGRAAAQALLVSDALFQSLEPLPNLRRELQSVPANRWLCRVALRELGGRTEPVEPTSRPLGTVMIHLAELALFPGVRPKVKEFLRQFRAAM